MDRDHPFGNVLDDLENIYPIERAYYLKCVKLLEKHGMVAHNYITVTVAGKAKFVCLDECYMCMLIKVLEK
jgi:hypothetical protein